MCPLREDLLDPRAHPNAQRVELRETHASLVFLSERDVYKVKKSVSFGFLDYRTIDLRKRACEDEVRLNVRLAPGTYVDVVPIGIDASGKHRVGHTERIVDWAVHMRRLPDERRGDSLLARGDLAGEHVDAIATRLARFHAESHRDTSTDAHGTCVAVERNVRENFAQTRHVVARYLAPSDAEELERWQIAFLHGKKSLFGARVAAGRVRDGHGDLRLEHVYFGDRAELSILDCIEFNDRLRFADVCADVAFLSMDLAFHGRVDLAERLLAKYAREADDFDLYALVDFYESYRAYVRAKVATLLAADDGVDLATRARAESDARRYFLLALSADRRAALTPTLVAVGGVIASGKSTVAERIAEELGAPIVDADRTRKAMLGVSPTTRVHEAAWKGAYDPAFTEAVYDEVLRRASVVLASGRPVVVDASFRSRSMRARARDLAIASSVPFRLVECRADAELCKRRLAQREALGGVSDGRLAIFDDFCARFEPIAELASCDHVVIDTSRPWPESHDEIVRHVATWPRGLTA